MATKMEESFLQLQTSIHGSKNGGETMWGAPLAPGSRGARAPPALTWDLPLA